MRLMQIRATSRSARRGAITALLALLIVGLVGFLALAIDIGMIAVARTQAQNAADLSALTAARTLNGDATTTYNNAAATTNAKNVLSYNAILGTAIGSSQLTIAYGSYDYNQTSQTFNANFPPTIGVPYTAVSTSVTASNMARGFSGIFGRQFLPDVTATAQAVHRPRDIALVMDLSGSMRFGTCTGYDFYTATRTTNNSDTLVPTFSHYSSASAGLVANGATRTSAYDNYQIPPSNVTAGTPSYTKTYINNFYSNAAYASTLVRAFDSYTSADGGNNWSAPAAAATPQLPPASYASVPGGDVPLYSKGSTTTFAKTVNDVVGGTATNPLWELDGYSGYVNGTLDTSGSGGVPKIWLQADYSDPACQFHGYTQGPGYYGKTFFVWPPDPRGGAIASGNLTAYLTMIGLTNATDQSALVSNWNTWLAQGPTTGLANLQAWLTGSATKGGPYKTTGPYVAGSSSKAPIYYAVCRLFNRAYPAGSANGAFAADWRVRFFGTNSNTVLFSSTGSLNAPGTYAVNYNAILAWIAKSPNPFPTQLRAGRIKYYGSIPTAITGSYPNWGSADQRFWVEYINYVLGFYQTGASAYTDVSAMAGYGADFAWGTVARNAAASLPQSMNYNDNPARPRLRFWFGPLMMVDYFNNYNMSIQVGPYFFMQPGDSYEAPLYTGKIAYLAAVDTMQKNHPNDWFSLVCYSAPRNSPSDNGRRFNCVSSPMGPNYNYAKSALLFPFSTINSDGSCNNTEVTPFDADPATGSIPSANFMDTPRADGSTCFSMGLMLAYNQFVVTPQTDATLRSFVTTAPITFPTGMAGGMGRKGSQKMIIFETDGLPNTTASASVVNNGSYDYYKVRYDMNRPNSSEYPAVTGYNNNDPNVTNEIYSLVKKLKQDHGTTRNPFRLYTIGFGPVFSGPDAAAALTTLQEMQYYAGTQSSPSTALPASQIITGTDAQMSSDLVTTFTNILQNGVQIALIK